MRGKLLSKIVIWALGTTKISGEDKAIITTALLRNIDALPIRDAITYDLEGTLMIRGKKLDLDQAQSFKQGVAVLKDNFARKLIQEQLLYECSKIGLHQGLTPEMIQFAKSCVWVLQNEEQLIDKLNGNSLP